MKKTWGISDLLGAPRNLNMYLVSVTKKIEHPIASNSSHSYPSGASLGQGLD